MTIPSTGVPLEPAWRQEEPAPPVLRLHNFLVWSALWFVVFSGCPTFARWITVGVLRLRIDSPFGAALYFFLYDTPRVTLLLVATVFCMGIGNTYFTATRAKRILRGRKVYVGNIFASLLGVVTPFCSCSAVPLFIGFVEGGIPLGVTFSFLVAAPMVNELALVMLAGLVGWRVALIYLCTGLSIAILSGLVLGRLHLEHHVEGWVRERLKFRIEAPPPTLTLGQRAYEGVINVRRTLSKVWIFILIGIGVGAAIHGYVPEHALRVIMGDQHWWSVPLVVAIGIPLYSNSAALLPIIQPLLAKGAALGTVLAFMMAAIGLSVPELIVLRRVLRVPLIAIFVAIVGLGILLTGWLFNALF